MLYIVSRNNEHVWHVGEQIHLADREILDIQVVQADGHELEYIATNMRNVPANTHLAVNRWYGDIAKFIAGNL